MGIPEMKSFPVPSTISSFVTLSSAKAGGRLARVAATAAEVARKARRVFLEAGVGLLAEQRVSVNAFPVGRRSAFGGADMKAMPSLT